MRVQWIVILFLALAASMGLLVIVTGQKRVLTELHQTFEKQKALSKRLSDVHTNRAIFKATIARLVAQGMKTVEEAEAGLAALKKEEATSKAEYEACQAEKTKTAGEFVDLEKKRNESRDAFKAEYDAWNLEFNSLKQMLKERRPICSYVKKDPLALKICGIETTEPLPTIKQEERNNHNSTSH